MFEGTPSETAEILKLAVVLKGRGFSRAKKCPFIINIPSGLQPARDRVGGAFSAASSGVPHGVSTKPGFSPERPIPQGLKAGCIRHLFGAAQAPQQVKFGLAGDPAKPRPFKYGIHLLWFCDPYPARLHMPIPPLPGCNSGLPGERPKRVARFTPFSYSD
jgi:hypothetical protein